MLRTKYFGMYSSKLRRVRVQCRRSYRSSRAYHPGASFRRGNKPNGSQYGELDGRRQNQQGRHDRRLSISIQADCQKLLEGGIPTE